MDMACASARGMLECIRIDVIRATEAGPLELR